jgi:hypothetical protein
MADRCVEQETDRRRIAEPDPERDAARLVAEALIRIVTTEGCGDVETTRDARRECGPGGKALEADGGGNGRESA